jgi:hypothetical protein
MAYTNFNDMMRDVQDRLYYKRSLNIRGIPHNDSMTTHELKDLRDNAPHDWRFDGTKEA